MHLSSKLLRSNLVQRSFQKSALPLSSNVHSQANATGENLTQDVDDKTDEVERTGTDAKPSYALPKPFLDVGVVNAPFKGASLRKAVNEMYMNPPDTEDFNWSGKWPVSRPFNPHMVPLPVRMGVAQNKCVTPEKYANVELLKLQNFLHLTPPAIKKQCEALKKFCTPFPPELMSDEACEKHLPLETHSADYITAANSLRDDRSRTITKRIRLCNLVLNDHARRKFIKLLGKDRYNRDTDVACIKSSRCPMKKQNCDFIDYVLTALYFESWVEEGWETRSEMNDYDGYYWWEDSASHKNLRNVFPDDDDETLLQRSDVKEYREAVKALKLEPEPVDNDALPESRSKLMDAYKQSVLKMLNLETLN